MLTLFFRHIITSSFLKPHYCIASPYDAVVILSSRFHLCYYFRFPRMIIRYALTPAGGEVGHRRVQQGPYGSVDSNNKVTEISQNMTLRVRRAINAFRIISITTSLTCGLPNDREAKKVDRDRSNCIFILGNSILHSRMIMTIEELAIA